MFTYHLLPDEKIAVIAVKYLVATDELPIIQERYKWPVEGWKTIAISGDFQVDRTAGIPDSQRARLRRLRHRG